MTGRTTVAETAQANARVFEAAEVRFPESNDAGGALGEDDADEAAALVRLDRQQRSGGLDAELTTDDELKVLMLFE